jgi:hypothetical protein
MTVSMTTLSIMTFSISILSKMPVSSIMRSVTFLVIVTLGILILGIMTVSMPALIIMTFSIVILSKMPLSLILCILTLSIMTYSMTTLIIKIFSITILNITTYLSETP